MRDPKEILVQGFQRASLDDGADKLAAIALEALDRAHIVMMWQVPCKTCEGTNVVPPGEENGLGCWDCFDGTEIVALTERPWPGWCQNCGAKLDPPDAISCRHCLASDWDE